MKGKYFPYGQERPSATADGKEKFATYFRDSETGLDYADQRYHQSGMGRFLTPDQYTVSSGPKDPGSWNRYAYAEGDPVNGMDPSGRYVCGPSWVDDMLYPACSPNGPYFGGPVISDGGGPCAGVDLGDGNPGSDFFSCTEALGLLLAFAPPQQQPPPPSCEDSEIAYITTYLSNSGSPLSALATSIVTQSDAAGIDDRFIVALAGAESSYGKTQQNSPTWGYYNAWSNASHCKALSSTSDCYKVDPYTSYNAALSDVVSLLTGRNYFGSRLTTVGAIYKKYNRVPAAGFLAGIYSQLVPGATVNSAVNFSRCP